MDKGDRTTEGPAREGPVILTTGETAELLRLKGYQLAYLLETKRIPAPRKTLLGRRLFYTQADLEEIRERLRSRS